MFWGKKFTFWDIDEIKEWTKPETMVGRLNITRVTIVTHEIDQYTDDEYFAMWISVNGIEYQLVKTYNFVKTSSIPLNVTFDKGDEVKFYFSTNVKPEAGLKAMSVHLIGELHIPETNADSVYGKLCEEYKTKLMEEKLRQEIQRMKDLE